MPPFETAPVERFNLSSLGEAALAYAAAGVPVLPLKPRDKQPIVAGGFKAATTNVFQVTRWWSEFPLANIGVVCGEPSGMWVIDIDPRHGGLTSLAQLQHDLDRITPEGVLSALLSTTRRQLTGGGGVHLFFRRRADLVVTTTTNWAGYDGIDVRAEKSYIIVAPSVHPDGGVYQWQNDLPLIPFPAALVTLAARRRRVRGGRRRSNRSFWDGSRTDESAGTLQQHEPAFYLHYAVSQAVIGTRNTKACWLGCRLVEDVGLDWEGAVPWMMEYVSRIPQHDHPYTEGEALRALAWAFEQAQSDVA